MMRFGLSRLLKGLSSPVCDKPQMIFPDPGREGLY